MAASRARRNVCILRDAADPAPPGGSTGPHTSRQECREHSAEIEAEIEAVVDGAERIQRAERRAERAEQRQLALEKALTSRATIDQVKGILMVVFGLDADASFRVLVWLSQQSNTKIADLCLDILRASPAVPDSLQEELIDVLYGRLRPRGAHRRRRRSTPRTPVALSARRTTT
ncbi:ANTAR domain-containing protein [Actinomycetospora sp. C-140]